MWALQSRINVQCISCHHITSIAPLLTFTEDVVTSTLPEPNSLTTPLDPTVCFALLLSLCMSLASVTFEPGARTAWHTHPLGQALIVTAGKGWVQAEDGHVEEIRPGDVVLSSPGGEALAWGHADHSPDAYCHSGKA